MSKAETREKEDKKVLTIVVSKKTAKIIDEIVENEGYTNRSALLREAIIFFIRTNYPQYYEKLLETLKEELREESNK